MLHTPGPWEYAVSGTAYSVTADADPVYIAVVEIPDRMSKVPQAEANARLIAASPDLLEVARFALEVAKALEDTDLGHLALDENGRYLSEHAILAIAKATK